MSDEKIEHNGDPKEKSKDKKAQDSKEQEKTGDKKVAKDTGFYIRQYEPWEVHLDRGAAQVFTVNDINSMNIGYATLSNSPLLYTISPEQQRLENEISELKGQNGILLKQISEKTQSEKENNKIIEKLKKNLEDLNEKQRFQYLLYRVNDVGRRKLEQSEEFRNRFNQPEPCDAFVMSIDIRRSTELMLKARQPQLYAEFIIKLCNELTAIILKNYGIFDKFTGDGILAFFPDFYAGEDAAYRALQAAAECHHCFANHYQSKRNCFISILTDTGLGIGIDYGKAKLVTIQDGLTLIGAPVVYACRLSGCDAGLTLLNQPAYEIISKKFGEFVNFQETEINLKHEGNTLAYQAQLTKKDYVPKLPDWVMESYSSK